MRPRPRTTPGPSGVRRAGAAIALALALAAAAGPLAGDALAQDTHLVVISGISGEPAYANAFHEWGTALVTAARERHRVPRENIVYLAERPDRDPALITGRATRENVERVLRDVAVRAAPGDAVFIVLIGHGGYDGRESRFNLVGPNLTADDFAGLLEGLAGQRVAFVNTASASGGFIRPLSGPNRAIVTATRSGAQNNATVFPRFFVDAFAQDGADVDRDGRVSLLEAYNYARREVARYYESQNRLATEHALLDDDGDGTGTAEPDPDEGGDGLLARSLFLGGFATVAADDASPELQALYRERQRLETAIDQLRGARATMELERYEAELERLLLELARTSQAIRELEGGGR